MTKRLLKEIFGLSEPEMKKLVHSASELLEEMINGAKEDEKTESYFNTKGCLYNNGELQEEYEKEYVNGECTKDVHFSANDTNPIEGKESEKTNIKKDLRNKRMRNIESRNDALTKENKALREQIKDMTEYIDGINDRIKALELRNSELQSVIDNVKKCF